MWNKLYKGFLAFFIIFWAAFIFLDYWQNHPPYYFAFQHFKYLDLTLIFIGLGVAVNFGVLKLQKSATKLPIVSGFTIFLLSVILIFISMAIYRGNIAELAAATRQKNYMTGSSLGVLGFRTLYTVASVYFILLVSHTFGQLLTSFSNFKFQRIESIVINVATGIMGIVALLFILGIFKFLHWFVILPIFLVILGIRWKESLAFLKHSLITPLKIKKLNVIGISSFYILLIIISLNLVQLMSPMPQGWDALSLYINLPSIIDDYSGLVKGFQPYNWSLFMALGFILFDDTSIAMALSSVSGIMCLVAMYALGKNWLKMDTNSILLALLLFYITPSIAFQSYLDLKVDLGLLFIILSVLIIFVKWSTLSFTKSKKKKVGTNEAATLSESTTTAERPLNKQYIILMGLMTGFALGIKFTTLFTFCSIVAAIWYLYHGKLAFLGMAYLSLFGILLLRLDDMSGLREYHLSANILLWILLVVGIILIGLSSRKNPQKLVSSVKATALYSCFFILPFLPWIGKNYIESGSLSTQTLLNGKSNAPNGSIQNFDKNWRQYKQRKK